MSVHVELIQQVNLDKAFDLMKVNMLQFLLDVFYPFVLQKYIIIFLQYVLFLQAQLMGNSFFD